MVRNLVHNLCESLVENIDGVAGVGKKTPPTPITYLTQWKIVGNSEVHTLPYPDGVVLPTGYKRCEYLTFDGNSYINTGVKTANDIGYNISCTVDRYDKVLIGGRISSSSDGFCCVYFNPLSSGGGIYYAYGNNTQRTDIIGSYVDRRKHTILFDNSIYQIDDEIISINRGTATEFADIYVGTWNNGGTPDNRMWIGNIYDTTIYNTQGGLWHGIPCLDANDNPCFYDLVSQTAFYNQGTGTLTYKLYPQPTEIWSCGEYSAVDGKYHILVQPLGGSIADIALTEPLRKVNDVADTIEFPSETEGKALVTRPLKSIIIGSINVVSASTADSNVKRWRIVSDAKPSPNNQNGNVTSAKYQARKANETYQIVSEGVSVDSSGNVHIYDSNYPTADYKTDFISANAETEVIYELATPTTELVNAPQIEEADSYSCVISQGGKAVSWSSFETE